MILRVIQNMLIGLSKNGRKTRAIWSGLLNNSPSLISYRITDTTLFNQIQALLGLHNDLYCNTFPVHYLTYLLAGQSREHKTAFFQYFGVGDYILKQGYFMDLVKTQNQYLSDNGI
jgi:hypothetical protein